MGNTTPAPQDYIKSFIPQICGGTAPTTDINTELQHKHKRIKSRLSTKSNINIKKPATKSRRKTKITAKKTKDIKKQLSPNIKPNSNINHVPLDICRSNSSESLSYHEGYVTASTVTASNASTRSNTITPNYHRHAHKINNKVASIPKVHKKRYRDDASLILDTLQAEKERESGEHWLDKYELDSLYIRNDLDYKWKICKIMQMSDCSVCIYNDVSGQYEWIDKRSSKIKAHPSYDIYKSKSNKHSLFIHQIKLQSPPILPCHTEKILYYSDAVMNREYIICCTEWNTFNSEYAAGVYRYDINYHSLEYLASYPVPPKAYFKATMDDINQQLHIYCFPTWSILDLKSKQWNVTSMSESVKYNLIDIEVTASLIVDGLLYIFGNGRFAKFDRSLMMFKEVGFNGIEHKYIWEVNDVIYVSFDGMKRIYIFGMSDSKPSFYRMWYNDIYYIDIGDKKLIKWKKSTLKLPYYTFGVFADYSVILGFKHFLFVFYHKLKELWIFDLLFEKRFKYNKSIRIELGEYCKLIINRSNNVIHSLCVDDMNGPIHIKLSLYTLLKNILIEYFGKLKADLVCGYIKYIYMNTLPLNCKTLIFNYYPQLADI